MGFVHGQCECSWFLTGSWSRIACAFLFLSSLLEFSCPWYVLKARVSKHYSSCVLTYLYLPSVLSSNPKTFGSLIPNEPRGVFFLLRTCHVRKDTFQYQQRWYRQKYPEISSETSSCELKTVEKCLLNFFSMIAALRCLRS